MFSPWNSLNVKNLNYKTLPYQTNRYYRKNYSKALKHQIGSLSSFFLPITNYSKILRIKIKSVHVVDFLISTKVRPKRLEHLHSEGIIFSELYFSMQLDKGASITAYLLLQDLKPSYVSCTMAARIKTVMLGQLYGGSIKTIYICIYKNVQ